MWPVLTPAQLLHDLFGGKALLRHAGRDLLDDAEWLALVPLARRPRSTTWPGPTRTCRCSTRPVRCSAPSPAAPAPGEPTDDDEIRTYGHIVVDEAQDLSPMQLRMLERRSLNGSMTVVGDIAQATGQWAHGSWDEILEPAPAEAPGPPGRAHARLPAPGSDHGSWPPGCCATPPPTSARRARCARTVRSPPSAGPAPGGLAAEVAAVTLAERAAVDPGQVAVICPPSMIDDVCDALGAAGIAFGRATRNGLEHPVTVVEVGLVKGLEVDAAVVVEPALIVDEEAQGDRALYVALTRATKRLAVVHEHDLPPSLLP